jgi:N-acetylgalactosamine kinase
MNAGDPQGFDSAVEQQRASALAERFHRQLGRPAAFVARAPGRVNLLGEHTDYNGLPVLPMAVDRSVLIAGDRRHDRQTRVLNTSTDFGERQFELADDIVAYPAGDWGNYIKAAAQGMVRHCDQGIGRGADLLVDSNVPNAAGLSSSSALVVASALALLAANEVTVAPETLAELLPGAERYVGTLSGGMDHAISLLARAGHALRIDFFPLRVRAVPLPHEYRIIVCHSLVQAEKSGPSKQAYNQRVIECRLACRLLETALGSGLPRALNRLGDLLSLLPGRAPGELIAYLSPWLPERPLSLAEIAAQVGTATEALRVQCEIPDGIADAFSIVRRVRHVLTEAERVEQAEIALRDDDAVSFAALMDASHASCRDDYDVSCPELEELVRIAKHAGALGARLTGAGFGGCTVNLVESSNTEAFLRRIDRRFYAPRLRGRARASSCRFVFSAQSGAGVWSPGG